MRAKTINEVQNFERGIDPKQSMDIGGIDIPQTYRDIMDEPKRKWEEFKKSFIGKTISGNFFVKKNSRGSGYKTDATIKVDDAESRGINIEFYSEGTIYESQGKVWIIE
jgi:hypothetical protein